METKQAVMNTALVLLLFSYAPLCESYFGLLGIKKDAMHTFCHYTGYVWSPYLYDIKAQTVCEFKQQNILRLWKNVESAFVKLCGQDPAIYSNCVIKKISPGNNDTVITVCFQI